MSTQPVWELVYATDYSVLRRDTTGVYPPELTIAQTYDDVDEDDVEATAAEVYRFPLERCWRVTVENDDGTSTVHVVDMNPARESELPHPVHTYKPWYAKHLNSIADSEGITVSELTDMLCSDDPRELASAHEAIGGVYGFANFDGYPQEWTASEFAAWPERGVKLSTNERDEFTRGYISCALWCGVMTYKHDDDCPCHKPAVNDDAYDPDTCTCEAEMVNSSGKHDESKLTSEAHEQLTSEAREFYATHAADLRASTLDMEQGGHDFWLTRNHHGAGFWDRKSRGEVADAALDRLTEASHAYGEQSLILDHTMKVSVL